MELLAHLLASSPNAILTAVDASGFRVEIPAAFPLGEHRALALTPERGTILDVIVPADRLPTVTAWDRAREHGIGVAAVHALSHPSLRMTLSMIDVRERYGVWIFVLHPDGDEREAHSQTLAAPLLVPTRPRQATLHKNMTAVITDVDENVTRMFGWTREQLIGTRATEFVHPDDRDRAVNTWLTLVSSGDSQRVRLRHRCADSNWLWIEMENVHNGAEKAEDVDIVAHISDISDEMAAHEALRRREELFRRLAESLPTGVLQLGRDGSVIYANARLREILRSPVPPTSAEMLARIRARDRAAVQAAIESAMRDGADSDLEVEIRPARTRTRLRCSLTIAAVADHNGAPAALLCVSDVTESARLRDELQRQATHDVLTGLPNHRALIGAIDHELERTRRNSRRFALAFIDLDHFKTLNDTLGHAGGDGALRETAQIIKATLRAVDIAGRWGGDEFVVLLPETDTAGALKAAERIRAAIAQHRFECAGGAHLTCTVGVATQPDDGLDRDTLVASADRAMYTAKQLGRNQVIKAGDEAAAALAADASYRGHEEQALLGAVEALAAAVDARDSYTAAHSVTVAALAQRIALRLGCDAGQTHLIGLAARLHDVGKVAIPDAILNKPARLTEKEWQLIRQHPEIGADDRRAHPDPDRRHAPHSSPPRALGRQRLSGWARGRGDPARRAHHRRRGGLQRDDHRAAVLRRTPGRGSTTGTRALRRHPVRPGDRHGARAGARRGTGAAARVKTRRSAEDQRPLWRNAALRRERPRRRRPGCARRACPGGRAPRCARRAARHRPPERSACRRSRC